MRLYRNLIQASIQALQQVFTENQVADRLVQDILRSNPKWGAKDRRFLATTIYDMVRWYRLYYEIYGKMPVTEADWWAVLGIMWTLQGEELPDWTEFEKIKSIDIQGLSKEFNAVRKIKNAIPDWLDEKGLEELGDKWDACIEASNQVAELVIRANSLKTNREKLQLSLDKKGIKALPWGESDAMILPERSNLSQISDYLDGFFEIQDGSSQQVAPFLNPQPNMTVIDACAGAGGKTLHLAALMKNKGKILALDIGGEKLQELQKRAKRAAASIVQTQVIKDINTIKALYNTADRLLLDVPCSGLGTLRRSPHIKWRLDQKSLAEVQQKQEDILKNYCQICKVGGLMVYATCSVLPSENQVQVQKFLSSTAGKNFKLLEEKSILPQDEGFDGFYMALLERFS